MNRLPTEKRAQILHLLLEGVSMRSTERITGCSINTIAKLLADAGEACAKYHDETVRNVRTTKVQCDELWSFCYAKAKNVEHIKGNPEHAGTVWTWTGLAVDSRLIVSWHVSQGREIPDATEFMFDLQQRLANRVTLATDGWLSYAEAVDKAFGGEVDYGQLVKEYEDGHYVGADRTVICGFPEFWDISTSYIERHNLTTRMAVRRYTRQTNAYSKKLQKHCYALALFYVHYNFCRPHHSLKDPYPRTPAMAAGLADGIRSMEWLVELVDANTPPPTPRGPDKCKRQPRSKSKAPTG